MSDNSMANDERFKFNSLGMFVLQTIAMWEEASKMPETKGVNYECAIEILRNTYSVAEMTDGGK